MLILAVHSTHRELMGKLLLAHKAAMRWGYAILGQSTRLRQHHAQVLRQGRGLWRRSLPLTGGVVLEVAATANATQERFPVFRQAGFEIASFDEEATAFFDPQHFAKRRYDVRANAQLALLFSWGRWHQQALQHAPIDPQKVVTSGHPRFEIYQAPYQRLFQTQIDTICRRYGAFILVNTNIPAYAFEEDGVEKRLAELERKAQLADMANARDLGYTADELYERARRARQAFQHKLNIVQHIAKPLRQEGVTLVLRPHHSVSAEQLKAYARRLGYAGHVDGRFSIAPWLYATRGILHHNCTTALEATLVGKPAIMFDEGVPVAEPVRDVSFVHDTPQTTAETLLQIARQTLDPTQLAEKAHALRHWQAHVDSSPSDVILDALSERGLLPTDQTFQADQIQGRVLHHRPHYVLGSHQTNAVRGADVFMKASDISISVKHLNAIFASDVRVKQVSDQIFLLYMSQSG